MRAGPEWTVAAGSSRDVDNFEKATSDGVVKFAVRGARLDVDADDGPSYTVGDFDSFTIDGREPTDEEKDEYSAELRDMVRQIYSQT